MSTAKWIVVWWVVTAVIVGALFSAIDWTGRRGDPPGSDEG